MKYGLDDKTIKQIISVLEKHPEIEKVILYGSRAKGNFKNGSDVDFTLVGKRLNLTIQNKMANDLDELLLPYTFDLSIYHQLSHKDLIDHIESMGVLFYSKS
jgi:predicted nucleotidyltransferase